MKPLSIVGGWMFALLLAACAPVASGAERGTLQVGAARVDITPAADSALPMGGYRGRKQGLTGIHDRIQARALVLHDGTSYAALVTWELINVPDPVWSAVSERVAKETGIPAGNLILAAVHSHSGPSLMHTYGNTDPKSAAYTETVEKATLEAVRRAKASLQPALVGAGTGQAYLNINRREPTAEGGWSLGQNPSFPSDKTVAVVRFDSMSGQPIALLINYGVHAVIMGPGNLQVSGDLAGATSRYVERFYKGELPDTPRGDLGAGLRRQEKTGGEGFVALWTSGAAGDQNPISLARGEDFTLVEAFGKMLGEQAIRVASSIRTGPNLRLRGSGREVTCAGRKRAEGQAANAEPKFVDTDPAHIRLGLIMLDKIALAGVSGEVLTMIGQRLKKEAPFEHTIMVTHANGSAGYIPNDAAYDQASYEVLGSRFKPGCAEGAIVNGFLDIMAQR
jgi:hypothetical protein